MLKILKLRVALLGFVGSLPLMVRLEAPSPLMVTAPAVPPVIAVVASMMFGNAAFKVMV